MRTTSVAMDFQNPHSKLRLHDLRSSERSGEYIEGKLETLRVRKEHEKAKQRIEQEIQNDECYKTKLRGNCYSGMNNMLLKCLVYVFPTGTILGRTFLFVAVHLVSLSFALMWNLPPANNNITTTFWTMIQTIVNCDRSDKYCGVSRKKYGLYGIGQEVTPISCIPTTSNPKLIHFCDETYSVTHSLAAFALFQFLSVVVWTIVWIFSEYVYLNSKDPYDSAKATTTALPSRYYHERISNLEKNNHHPQGQWYQARSRYHSKCTRRSEMEQASLFWRLLYSFGLLLRMTVNIFIVTWGMIWYWGHTEIDIVTKNILPIVFNVFCQLSSDSNLIAKIIFAWRRFMGWKDGRYSVCKAELLRSDLEQPRVEPSNDWSNQVCMLIACHLSASSDFEAAQLRRTLEAALVHFPAKHIFVCDNANNDEPPDDTQRVVEGVHPDINYLYIPIGSKSFALYWTEKYWLSHLQQMGRLPRQASNYILTVDDDVRLPNNFSVPVGRLTLENDIAAVQYQVIASDPNEHEKDGKPLLVGLQDIEYMGFSQIPESYVAPPSNAFSLRMLSWCSPLYCSGALAVWRKEDFRDVMKTHDSVFHGEDLQMGLLLIAQRTCKRIVACDDREIVISTTAPANVADLLRQRVKSWDLITVAWGPFFFFPRLLQAVYHASRGHKTSMKTVPWLFSKLVLVMTIYSPSISIVRIGVYRLLFPHLHLNNLIVGLLFLVSVGMQYLCPLIYYGHSKDVVPSWRLPTMRELLVWPVYMWCCSAMMFLAHIYNLTTYGHSLLPPSLQSREMVGDLPPCPIDAFPDWKTIWKV